MDQSDTLSLTTLKDQCQQGIEAAGSLAALDDVRVAFFGKKGAITALNQSLRTLSVEEKKTFGKELNHVRTALLAAFDSKRAVLQEQALNEQLEAERLDVTLPPQTEPSGALHPVYQTMAELIEIFGSPGFMMKEGPDIETDFNNFTALNIPASHPARQEHDTFYCPATESGDVPVLRTHTSPVQIRTLMSEAPPLRIMSPGRTYRCDDDATHAPNFHQMEGLVVEPGVHMGHLKHLLLTFVRQFFENDNIQLRFRPAYFPFTEPSAEIDIGYSEDNGILKLGGSDNWLEILGCGMVHPAVLRNCGVDPSVYQGFAFGMGIERVCMLKYGMRDLRAFFDGDQRWLKHYGSAPLWAPTLVGGLSS
jgi:phenylalanyl-tRNA synthetase alpha chain